MAQVAAIEVSQSLSELAELAELINESHSQCQQARQNAEAAVNDYLSKARATGEFLLHAKRQVRHGQWLPWLRENCPEIAERTAQMYMYVATNWGKAESKLTGSNKSATVADLGIRKFLELIKEATDEVVDGELVQEEQGDPLPPPPVRLSSSRGGRYREQPPAQSKKRSQKFQPGDVVKVIRTFNRYEKSYLGLEVTVVEVFDNFALCRTPHEFLDKVPFLFSQLQLVKSAETEEYLVEDILWIFEHQLVTNQKKCLVETLIDKLPMEQQIHLAKSIQNKFATVR